MSNTQMSEGIHDRVLHGGGRPDRARLPDPLGAEGIHAGGGFGVGGLEGRQVRRARHQIRRQRAGDGVPHVVEHDLLEERLGDALRDSPVLLTPHERRVQDPAAVIDGHVSDQVDRSGLLIHLDHRDMGAEGERRARLAVDPPRRQRGPAILRGRR